MPQTQDSAKPRRPQIKVELPANLEATYANFAVITHSPSEMFIDFARILPNSPTAKICARVVMTPFNAKLLLKALQENLANYERRFGEIQMPGPEGFEPGRPISFDRWIR
jgi:hypothetical protein